MTDETVHSSAQLRSSWPSSSPSAIESVALCRSCRGTGLRPPTGLWVELPGASISAVPLPTSRPSWSLWLRRVLLVLAASVFAKVGLSTSILDALAVS